jgi:hypothetical protein
MPERWSLTRWIRESRAYTRPMPWWRFYPTALAKWPAFNRQQRRDAVEIAAAEAHWAAHLG